MAYQKTVWVDHVVEKPRTYTYVDNSDGSRTFTPASGEVIQQGTPKSATNFNNIENGLADVSVVLDWVINLLGQLEMADGTESESITAMTASIKAAQEQITALNAFMNTATEQINALEASTKSLDKAALENAVVVDWLTTVQGSMEMENETMKEQLAALAAAE